MSIRADALLAPDPPRLTPSFGDIIGPLTSADLSALYRKRQFHFEPASDEAGFSDILDCDTLWSLIGNGTIPLAKLRVSYGRRIVKPLFYSEGGSVTPGKLASLFAQGCSIIAGRIEPYVPAIRALCRDAERCGFPIAEVGAIATQGSGGAFPCHYDMHDMVILQVEGRKRWRVFGPRVRRPVRELCCKNPPRTAPEFDRVLVPGDMMFLPSGFWHECDNERDRSLHIGLFMDPPPADDDHSSDRTP